MGDAGKRDSNAAKNPIRKSSLVRGFLFFVCVFHVFNPPPQQTTQAIFLLHALATTPSNPPPSPSPPLILTGTLSYIYRPRGVATIIRLGQLLERTTDTHHQHTRKEEQHKRAYTHCFILPLGKYSESACVWCWCCGRRIHGQWKGVFLPLYAATPCHHACLWSPLQKRS